MRRSGIKDSLWPWFGFSRTAELRRMECRFIISWSVRRAQSARGMVARIDDGAAEVIGRNCMPSPIPTKLQVWNISVLQAKTGIYDGSRFVRSTPERQLLGVPIQPEDAGLLCVHFQPTSDERARLSFLTVLWSPEICATFQVPQCHGARWRRTISRHNDSAGSASRDQARWHRNSCHSRGAKAAGAGCCTAGAN